jgi:hypothetical protein
MHQLRSASRLRRDVERFIGELGANSREISTRLLRDGIRGTPKNTLDCVVARYLGAVLASDSRIVSVDVSTARIFIRRVRRGNVSVPIPDALRKFIDLFDEGRFPGLVRSDAYPVAQDPETLPAAIQVSVLDAQETAEAPSTTTRTEPDSDRRESTAG